MDLLLSIHDDDSTLFASFLSIRIKPLIVVATDSWIQPLRGDKGCSAQERSAETAAACQVLGCSVIRLGIRDDNLFFDDAFRAALWQFKRDTPVYLPALQGGNPQHDIVSRVGSEFFKNVTYYATYAKGQHFTPIGEAVIPTEEEMNLKDRALDCYQSQLNLSGTKPHFDAVRRKPEYLLARES